MGSWRSAPTRTRTPGEPTSPRSAMSQPARRSTSSRPAARQVKFAIVPPVTKPTALSGGRPSRSVSQPSTTSSTAAGAGVRVRSPEFWSHALVSQSAASAAGCVPPMTMPKNRPDGIAVRPGSHACVSRSTTLAGSVGPSGRSVPSAATTSSADTCGGTGRSWSESSQAVAWRCARSSADWGSIRPVWDHGAVASTSTIEVLDRATWRARADRHARRVDAFVAPHLARREARVKHPVHDFLFTYYSQRPAQLRCWHPGYGVGLAGEAAVAAYAGLKGYAATDAG